MKQLSALVSIVVASLLISPVHAASIEPTIKTEMKLLYRSLSAAKDSKVVLDSVEVYKEDTTQHVRVGQTRPVNGQSQSYTIEVDLETGTYTAELTPESETSNEYSSKKELQSISPLAINDYNAYVTAKTLDPFNVTCNTTTFGWGWSEIKNSTGSSFSYRSRSLSHWEAQPTSLGTYWYSVSSDYNNDPSGTYQSVSSTYVNDDFLGGIVGKTYTKHNIRLTSLVNGRYHYYVELITKGDVGPFLHLGVKST